MMVTVNSANLHVSGDRVNRRGRAPPASSPRDNNNRNHVEPELYKAPELPPRTREPLVSIACSCPRRRPVSAIRPSSRTDHHATDEDSSSDSDDEGIGMGQLIRAFRLYGEKPPNSRSLSALRNLIAGFRGEKPLQEEHVEQLLCQLSHPDQGLREAALLTIGQLCSNHGNTKSLLDNNVLHLLFKVLSSPEKQPRESDVVAQVLQKILGHASLCDHWLDEMLTRHVHSLLDHMTHAQTPAETLAFARVVRVLATYDEACHVLMGRHLAAITRLRNGDDKLQGQYCGILAELVMRAEDANVTEHICHRNIKICLDILERSTCVAQLEAAELLAALATNSVGHRVLIQKELVPYLMSAILDSNCRQVRSASLHAISELLANIDSLHTEKTLLHQVDAFFHSHEEEFSQPDSARDGRDSVASDRRDVTSSRLRAVDDLTNSLLNAFCAEAQIRLNKTTKAALDVKLVPTVDTDVTVLTLLRHCVTALGRLTSLKTNCVKVKVDLPDGCTDEELDELLQVRKTTEKRNHKLALMLVENGALCMLDLLHAYTVKLNETLRLHASQKTKQAWTKRPSSAKKDSDPLLIFDDNEVKLIESLLRTISMVTWCTCDDVSPCGVTTEELIAERLKKHHTRHREYTIESLRQSSEAEKSVQSKPPEQQITSFAAQKLIDDGDDDTDDDDDDDEIIDLTKFDDPDYEEESAIQYVIKKYKRIFTEKTKMLKRQLRVRLYQGGVLESVGPWLACSLPNSMGTLAEILEHMLQPLEEFVLPFTPVGGQKNRFRPISAMTPKERDQALSVAVNKMSSNMRGFIRDALGTTLEEQEDGTPTESPAGIVGHPRERNLLPLESTGGVHQSEEEDPTGLSAHHSGTTLECDSALTGSESNATINHDVMSLAAHDEDDDLGVYDDDDDVEIDEGVEVIDDDDSLEYVTSAASSQAVRKRPYSAKQVPLTCGATKDGPSYDRFARTPSRPSSAKSLANRPSSAKVVPRDQDIPVKQECAMLEPKRKVSNTGKVPRKAPRGAVDDYTEDRTALWQLQLRTDTKPSMDSRPRQMDVSKGKPLPRITPQQRAGQMKYFPNIEVNKPKAKPKPQPKPTKPVFSKPVLDPAQPVTYQCQRRLVNICGSILLELLFSSKDVARKSVSLRLLEKTLLHAQGDVHMVLSQHGIVPKLVDFLRVNDDDHVMEIYGLTLVQQLVQRDIRLKQLFHKHGGTQLLMAMSNYTVGPLREEVCKTLRCVSRGLNGQISKTGARIVQSAPPGRVQSTPDVWDHIMMRWRNEDRVKNLLRSQHEQEPWQTVDW